MERKMTRLKKKTFWLKKTIKVLHSSDEPIKIIIIDYW